MVLSCSFQVGPVIGNITHVVKLFICCVQVSHDVFSPKIHVKLQINVQDLFRILHFHTRYWLLGLLTTSLNTAGKLRLLRYTASSFELYLRINLYTSSCVLRLPFILGDRNYLHLYIHFIIPIMN